MSLSLTALVTLFAGYGGVEQRATARSPQWVRPGTSDASVVARYLLSRDALEDFRAHTVVLIEPLREDIAPPPGLRDWPAPGEVFLSSELLKDGAREQIEQRYGRFAGTIDPSGLASPRERFAYARPASGLAKVDGAQLTSGFGGVLKSGVGDPADAKPIWQFAILLVTLLVLPSAALAIVAARMGAQGRDRRTALVTALGATRGHRALMDMGESAPPALLGALLGASPAALSLFVNLPLPWVSYTLYATDQQRALGQLALSVLVSILFILAAVIALHRPARKAHGSTRPGAQAKQPPRWVCWLCPIMLVLAVQGPGFALSPPLKMLIHTVGVIGTLATLPVLIAAACRAGGLGLARLGNRMGSPSAVIAGRWSAAHPGAIARLVGVVVISIGLLGQVQLYASRMGQTVIEAAAVQQQLGSSVLTLSATGKMPTAFEASLPAGARLLAVEPRPEKGKFHVTGACSDLRTLSLPCEQKSVPLNDADTRIKLLAGNGFDDILVAPGSARTMVNESGALPLLFSSDGSNLDTPSIKVHVRKQLAPTTRVEVPGRGWLGGGKVLRDQSQWLLLTGILGITSLAVAFALNALAEFTRLGSAAAPVSVLSGRRTIFYRLSGWALFGPITVAVCAGVVVYVLLAQPLVADGRASVSNELIAAIGAGSLILAALLWTLGAKSAVSYADRWKPGGD